MTADLAVPGNETWQKPRLHFLQCFIAKWILQWQNRRHTAKRARFTVKKDSAEYEKSLETYIEECDANYEKCAGQMAVDEIMQMF